MSEDQRRTFLAFGLIAIILIIWQVFVMGPADRERREQLAAQQASELAQQALDPDLPLDAQSAVTAPLDRDEALGNVTRIEIDAPAVSGTLSLTGARFDDLQLRRHFTEAGGDEPVSLLNPIGGEDVFYARDGWQGAGLNDLPGGSTQWSLVSGDRLTPDTPIVLSYDSESGLSFRRTISIDDNYLFTVADQVTNNGAGEQVISRYGLVRHEGVSDDPQARNIAVFEGAQIVADGQLTQRRFPKLEDGEEAEEAGTGGWVSITRRYWLTAVIPDQSRPFTGRFRMIERGNPEETSDNAFEASYVEGAVEIAPGQTLTSTAYVFAGAKELDVLSSYRDSAGIAELDRSINWGWLWFLTKPFVLLLNMLAGMTGHFGLAILILTLMIKIVMFPLANRAYASMAKMKTVQPKIQELRERYANDQQKLQQAQLDLFKKEKINPAAGCVPILPQIPVFFALFQTLFISLEMRHQPFWGWINDLAAPDPTTMWNLFGILPFDAAAVPLIGGMIGGTGMLAVGLWPLIMGITMWAQQALNPPPPDPMQARIFAFLPVIFTIVLANFPAGLVIYYTWNNALTVAQQYYIMRRHGNETQLDKLIARLSKRKENEPED